MIGTSFAQAQLLTTLFQAFDLARAGGNALEGKVLAAPANGQVLVNVAGKAVLADLPPEGVGGFDATTLRAGATVGLQLDSSVQPPRILVLAAVEGKQSATASGAESATSTPSAGPAGAGQAASARLGALRPDVLVRAEAIAADVAAVTPHSGPRPVAPALAVLAQSIVARSVAEQQGFGPVFAALRAAFETPQIARALPPGFVTAARDLYALPLDGAAPIRPDAVARAIAGGGPFYEARLAAGDARAAHQDAKGALALLAALGRAFGGAPAADGHAAPLRAAPEPPWRGGLPEAQPPIPVEPAQTARAQVQRIVQEAEGALERIRLHQYAALPEAPAALPGETRGQETRLSVDVPIFLGRETAVAGLVIEQEGRGAEAGEVRPWHITIALDFPETGPVYARLGLRGAHLSIALFAERAETTALFETHAEELRAALHRAAFEVGDLTMITGRPPETPRPAGHFLDRAS